jgi:putative ABC transport system permease protein
VLKGRSLEPDQLVGYYKQIVNKIEATTGVQSAAAVVGMPLEGSGFGMPFMIDGEAADADPSKRHGAGFQMITPDYFKTFGIRVVRGRAFTENDNAASVKVAMVNEQFVKTNFPGKNPIGQRLLVEQLIPGVQKLGPYQAWEIVGVFHDVRGGSFERQREEIDIPFYQIPWVDSGIGVLTSGDPATMTKTVAAAVHSVDPAVALSQIKTLDQIKDEALSGDRFNLVLFVSFAAIALALAAVGIYGVMAFSVGQREHEIGVRMALGATRDRVVMMVLREGAMLALVGLVLGLVGAYFVGRAMHSMLYGVGNVDLTAFSAVGALLLIAALVACYFPARRAAAVEPMRALRIE